MYEYLQGKLTVKNLSYVTLDINGIGFKIYTTLKSYEVLNSLGEQEKLFIHTIVKEDDISFYGFKTEIEREFFRNCISISGVGAKKAIAILSTFNYSELTGIVKAKNSKELAKVPGIGVKKAEKIIIDLIDKLDNIDIMTNIVDESLLEIISKKENLRLALESLGYDKIDVSLIISDSEFKELEMQDLIKLALLNINKKKK